MSCEIIHSCNIVLQVQRPGTGSRNRSNSSALRSVMLGNLFSNEIPVCGFRCHLAARESCCKPGNDEGSLFLKVRLLEILFFQELLRTSQRDILLDINFLVNNVQ